MAKAKIPKQKVTFTFLAPEAKEVLLAADFTEWEKAPVALKKQKSGKWQKVVSLPAGLYEYRFIVDGQWVTDPEAAARQANPYGGENSTCLVTIELV